MGSHLADDQPRLAGEHGRHLLARFRRRELEREQRVVAEEHGVVMTPSGDAHKLRGIPAVGTPGGLGGAIPGTRPEQELLRRERRGLLGGFGLKSTGVSADTLDSDEADGSGLPGPPDRPPALHGP